MKKVFYAIALLFVLATLNSCSDYENNADIENLENQKALDTGHDEYGDDQEEPEEETGAGVNG